MIIDSSAIVSIVFQENDAAIYAKAMELSENNSMSAANFLEASIVIDGSKDQFVSMKLDQLIETASIKIEPVTETQAKLARQAYQQYGKGSGHKAQLNFGDCFAYALAQDKNEPLLFKGADFSQTDIQSAL